MKRPGPRIRSFLFFFLLICPIIGFTQEKEFPCNDREIFGRDYTFALNIIERNGWWSDTLQSHGLEPAFALSVVFPELIRYSSILDYIEIKSLEVLYVQYGKDYADFSIGYFQMKPSFAERIEADILKYGLDRSNPEFTRLHPTLPDNSESRKERVLRLKDEYHQLLYLEAFTRIMDYRFGERFKSAAPAMKLKFYATAYNTGYFKATSVIENEMIKKRFYCGLDATAPKFSYAEIAAGYFLRQ